MSVVPLHRDRAATIGGSDKTRPTHTGGFTVMTDYRWLAESVLMTSATLARDLRAAIDHARNVPGDITPAQADRLGRLADALDALEGAKV